MLKQHKNITFRKLSSNDPMPYELLLLADPSKEIVDRYLKNSGVYTAILDGESVGVIVLFPISSNEIEIKNVAVNPALQGQGIGTYLIENVIQLATSKNKKSLHIGTANSSIGQLSLYQKLGFEIMEIKKDFFVDNYPQPIYENNIQAKHLLVLIKNL